MKVSFTVILRSVPFLLLALFTLPPKAQAMPTLWEIQLNRLYFFNVQYELSPDSAYYLLNAGPMEERSTKRFFLDSDFGAATSLSNIVTPGFGDGGHVLCGVANCLSNLTAAGLFLDATPNIVGLVWDTSFVGIEELSFDGWFTQAGYNWENPLLPALPLAFKDIGPNQFVRRFAYTPSPTSGFRELELGTYSLRQIETPRAQMPEPSTLILLGVGLLALVARFRKTVRSK